jgi:hypothetical protein
VTDELAPLVLLAAGSVTSAAVGAELPAWAMIGALAGYALSGSV